MEIGQKLKDKRTGLGLSQEQLAEQLEVTRQTIANWEKGKTYPDIGSVLKLSDLYSVSLDELLKEDRSMRKHKEEAAALPKNTGKQPKIHPGAVPLPGFMVLIHRR